MSKTVEELLAPRYKVIADSLDTQFEVGDIIHGERQLLVFNTLTKESNSKPISNYPHLFKKLEWHEERTIMDLPDYIKWKASGDIEFTIFKVNNWYSSPNSFDIAGCDVDGGRLFIKDCQPATESEYNQYIASKK